jgi:hypothetical protein
VWTTCRTSDVTKGGTYNYQKKNIWGLNGVWKEVDKVHRIFFVNKIIGIPNCAANGFAELELGRKSRRSKC